MLRLVGERDRVLCHHGYYVFVVDMPISYPLLDPE